MGGNERVLLHRLNGQLIAAVQTLFPSARWDDWIINVIILHRRTADVEQTALQTSATWYKGELYDRQERCTRESKVRTLDMNVPLQASLAGYCVTTGNIVWVDELVRLSLADPLHDLYKEFTQVGVDAPEKPNSEYVFPIGFKNGAGTSCLGVLNCEWYGDASVPSPFAELKRNVVSDLIMSVARAHAPFIAIALNPEAARTGDFSGILSFHSTLLENRVQRLRSGETL